MREITKHQFRLFIDNEASLKHDLDVARARALQGSQNISLMMFQLSCTEAARAYFHSALKAEPVEIQDGEDFCYAVVEGTVHVISRATVYDTAGELRLHTVNHRELYQHLLD